MRNCVLILVLCPCMVAILGVADSCQELTEFKLEINEQFRKLKIQFEKLRSENDELRQELSELRKDNYRRADSLPTCCAAHIAFHAALGTAIVALQDNQKIIYKEVITNIQNAYDVNKGVFFAPKNGFYVFLVHFQTMPHKYVETNLKKNGLNLLFTRAGSDSTTLGTSSNSIVIHLVAGDQIWVEVYGFRHSSDIVLDSRLSTITGFLLYPTSF